MNKDLIRTISTFAALVPFTAGMFVYKKAGVPFRLFAFFLLYGFLTDFFTGYFWRQGLKFEAQTIFFVYLLAEAMFICWFISQTGGYAPVSEAAYMLFIFIIFPWAFAHIDFLRITWKATPFTGMFNTVFKMTAAVLASWSILHLTQKKEPIKNSAAFWFLCGIFFYSFCTFFISAFMQSPEMQKFWFVHNIINVITYGIYMYGFITLGSATYVPVDS